MKSVFTANVDSRVRSIDEMSDIAYIDIDEDENDGTVVRPAATPECHNQKADDADSERGVFDYFSKPTRPAYAGTSRTSHLAASSADSCYLGPRYTTLSGSNRGTKNFIDARHRGCDQTDVVQARTAQVLYGDSHDSGTTKFPGWPRSRSFPTSGDAAGSFAAKTTEYVHDRDPHVMSSSLSYSSKYTQYRSERSEFDSYEDSEDIQRCSDEQLKQSYANKEAQRLNTAKSDEAFSVSDSQASDSDDSSREQNNHGYFRGSTFETAGINGSSNVDSKVHFPLSSGFSSARSANDSSTVRSNVHVADDCTNFVTYSDRSAVTSSYGASARPVYVTEGSRTMTSAPTSDWRIINSQDDRRWMDSTSADEDSQSNHVVPARVFPQSRIVCPQYQLISDDHRRYSEDDIDYESRMASQKSAQQLERMQRRRQAKMEKQSAGLCAADDVPGYRGKDSIDDLISYIDPSLCDDKTCKKQSKKKKKPSAVAVNSLLAESAENLSAKSTQAKACKSSSDKKAGLHMNQQDGKDLVLEQSVETELGHNPVSVNHEGMGNTECLNWVCDVTAKRDDKLDPKSCGDEIVDQGTSLQSDLASRCTDENAIDVDHVPNSSSVLGQNVVSENSGVESLLPLTSSISSSSQLQDVCDSDSSLCSSGIPDAAFITVQKKKRVKHSAGGIPAVGLLQNAQDKIADSNGELNQLKNLVDNLHVAGAGKSMSTVSDSSRQHTSKVVAGPATIAAGGESRAEQSYSIRPFRDNSSLKASQSRSISSKDAKTPIKSRHYQNVDRIAVSGTSINNPSSKVNDVKACDQNESVTESCSLSNVEFPVLSESKSVPNPSVHASNAVSRTKSAPVNLVKSTSKTTPQDALSLLNTEPMGVLAPSAGPNEGFTLSSDDATSSDGKQVNEKMYHDVVNVLPFTSKQNCSVDGVMSTACSITVRSIGDNSASADLLQSVGDASGDSQSQVPAFTAMVTSADLQTALSKPAVSDVKFLSKQCPTESSTLQSSAASNRPAGESVVFLDTQNPNCLLSPPRCDISFGFEIETDLLQSVLPANIQSVSMTEPVQLPEDQQSSVLTTACQEVEPLDIVASTAGNCVEQMAPAINGPPVWHYLPGCPTVLYCMHPAFQSLTYQYLPPQGALFHVNRCTPVGVVPPMPSEAMTLPPPVVEMNDNKEAESFASLTENELLKNTCVSPFNLTAAQIFLYSEYMKASESAPTVHYCDKPMDN